MRYIVYGAGAVGGTIGAALFESGRDVVLIARGEHGRAIAAGGLRFGTPAGWRTLAIPVVDRPARLTFGYGDIVVLAMKSQDTQAALDALRVEAPPETPIVCAQNGVENERRALRLFANVHGMCVFMATTHLEPGAVTAHQSPKHGVCDVGRFPRGKDRVDEEVAADLEASALISLALDDVMPRKYDKLLTNLGNVLEAAVGRSAWASTLADRARAEATVCFAVAGITTRPTDEPERLRWRQIQPVAGVERGGGSTWQSLARGAPALEIDDLNGEIVLLGRLYGVPTPVNAMLQRLAVRMVREGLQPGSVSLEDLERDLG